MKLLKYCFVAALFISFSATLSASWKHAGLGGENIRSMTVKNSVILASAESGNMYRSQDKGESWEPVESENLPGKVINEFFTVDDLIYAGSWGGGVLASSDDGLSWQQMNQGITDMYITGFGSFNGTLFASTRDNGIFRYDKDASAWIASNQGLTDSSVSFLAVFDQMYMVVFTFDKAVFVSSDGGQSWINAYLSIAGMDVSTFCINGLDIFVGVWDQGIYCSANMGMTWTPVNEGLLDKSIRAIAVKGDSVLAATDGGIYASTDYAKNWQQRNSGLDTLSIQSLLIIDDIVFAGSFDGLYKTNLNDVATSVGDMATNAQYDFLIGPNPSDSYVNIIPGRPADISTIKISDIKGTQVLSRQFQTGLSSEKIDVSTLPAGLYFMTIESGSGKAVRMFVKK